MSTASPSRRRKSSGIRGSIFAVPASLFAVVVFFLAISEAVHWISGDLPGSDTSQAALARLTPGELDEAEQRATSDVRSSPLDVHSLLTLARINEIRGRTEEADLLRLAAGVIRPHDPQLQGEVIPVLLKRGDLATVTRRLDGMIRGYPWRQTSLFDVLAELSGVQGGAESVASLLADDPPWRKDFLAYLVDTKRTDIAASMIDALSLTRVPAQPEELARLINDQIKMGAISDAYRNWLVSLSDEERSLVKSIYDGGFEAPIRNLTFDWTVLPGKGLSYQLIQPDGRSKKRNLSLNFDGYSGKFANLSQLLMLSPGLYRIRGEAGLSETGSADFEGLAVPDGFSFRIYCRDGSDLQLIEETGPLPRTKEMLPFEKMFRIPTGRCKTQLLRLEAFPNATTKQKISGKFWLGGLSIDNLEKESM